MSKLSLFKKTRYKSLKIRWIVQQFLHQTLLSPFLLQLLSMIAPAWHQQSSTRIKTSLCTRQSQTARSKDARWMCKVVLQPRARLSWVLTPFQQTTTQWQPSSTFQEDTPTLFAISARFNQRVCRSSRSQKIPFKSLKTRWIVRQFLHQTLLSPFLLQHLSMITPAWHQQ